MRSTCLVSRHAALILTFGASLAFAHALMQSGNPKNFDLVHASIDDIDLDGDGFITRREYEARSVPSIPRITPSPAAGTVSSVELEFSAQWFTEKALIQKSRDVFPYALQTLSSPQSTPLRNQTLVRRLNSTSHLSLRSEDARAESQDSWREVLRGQVAPEVPDHDVERGKASKASIRQWRRLFHDSDGDNDCCSVILDPDTTCVTQDRLYGDYALQGVNDDPYLCAEWCIVNYPSTQYTDLFKNFPWCNCYASCPDTRDVSTTVFGSDGGDVTTLEVLESPPPVPPPLPPLSAPPPSTPSPPPLPPVPPLQVSADGIVANVSSELVLHAGEQLAAALSDPNVTVVFLYSNVSLEEVALPNVTRDMELVGECGAALCEISANRVRNILHVEEGVTLVLRTLALRFGYSVLNGGALYLQPNATAALHGCLLEGNEASESGGGVYMAANSTLTLVSSHLRGNMAHATYGRRGGGAVYAGSHASIQVWESHMVNNSAARMGGALVCEGDSVFVARANSTVALNSAGSHGGGLFLYRSTVLFEDAELVHNRAGKNGGGLDCIQACQIEVVRSSVADNSAEEHGGGLYGHVNTHVVIGPGSAVVHNTADGPDPTLMGKGGGIFLYSEGTLTVQDSAISHNSATSGGGVYGDAGTVLSIDGSVLEGNYASQDGGGIYTLSGVSIYLSSGSALRGNSASGNGGGVAVVDEDQGVHEIMVTASTAIEYNLAGGSGGGLYAGYGSVVLINDTCHISHNIAKGDGGGISLNDGGNLCIHSSSVLNNSAGGAGGAVASTSGCRIQLDEGSVLRGNSCGNIGGGISGLNATNLTLHQVYLSANSADDAGGGVALGGQWSSATISESVMDDSFGTISGGCLFVSASYSTVTILNSTMTNCSATGSSSSISSDSGQGGAIGIKTQGTTLTISASSLTGNNAKYGGAIAFEGEYCTARVHTSVLEENTADPGDGGVLLLTVVSLGFEFTDCAIANNSARTGGVVAMARSYLGLAHSQLSDNSARSTGGCISAEDSELMLTDSLFTGHEAITGGVVILSGWSSTMEGYACYFGNNAGLDRGGVLHADGAYQGRISGSALVENRAFSSGGAVFFGSGAELEVELSALQRNYAIQNGGTVYGYQASLVFTEVILSQNLADDNGGGVTLLSSIINVTGALITGNRASGYGGGILASYFSEAIVTDSNLTLNTASKGGALYVQFTSHATLQEVVLRGNWASGSMGGALLVDLGTSLLLSRAMLLTNEARTTGGAVAALQEAQVVMEDSVCEGNAASRGGALYLMMSSASIHGSTLSFNVASDTGGGVHLQGPEDTNSTIIASVAIEGCTFYDNAGYSGGGIYVGNLTGLSLHNAVMEGNQAVSEGENLGGGAVAMERTVANSTLSDVQFTNNNASKGGACFLAGDGRMPLQMRNLSFGENHVAETGASLFWMVNLGNITAAIPPTCSNCTGLQEHLGTNPMTFTLQEEFSDELLSDLSAHSNEELERRLRYVAYDFYSELTVITESFIVDVTYSCDGFVVSGSLFSLYNSYFQSLTFTGQPGAQCSVSFVPTKDVTLWRPAALLVSISLCRPGEWYNAPALQCTHCPAGEIKFSNSSKACVWLNWEQNSVTHE
ncbi:hypothetical protein CYMTET_48877 [Cymbomonas tetramitiformis]|uniref:Pectate lyase C n=1 Tax=Cymbomonas tetramitiformis TaxID=36881 RepID=A0AAE0BT23_9CHLO|nr:hypothetical protein CYMTET_48877 [Cymbomonas tetramitiformis]